MLEGSTRRYAREVREERERLNTTLPDKGTCGMSSRGAHAKDLKKICRTQDGPSGQGQPSRQGHLQDELTRSIVRMRLPKSACRRAPAREACQRDHAKERLSESACQRDHAEELLKRLTKELMTKSSLNASPKSSSRGAHAKELITKHIKSSAKS